jgi:transcriptional regulator with XRE-family HTH domain
MHDLDDYVQQKKAMGHRFKQFRELIGKSRKELVEEAEEPLIMEQRIKMFEYGAIIPDIIFIQHFTEEYGLNLTWLVIGAGSIFTKKGAKTPKDIFLIFRDTEPTDHLINEIIRSKQQAKEEDIPKQMPGNWAEVDGRMMW